MLCQEEKQAARCLYSSDWIQSQVCDGASQPCARGAAHPSAPPSSPIWTRRAARAVPGLALTTHDMVLLVRQFRPGPEAILLELPGGGVSPGEDPALAAARELLEETGYRGELELAGSSWHCAYSTMRTYHFVARQCVKVQEPTPDDQEFLEVVE